MNNLSQLLNEYEHIGHKLFGELHTRVDLMNRAALVSETDVFGTITFVNQKFCEVSQYSEEELLGSAHNIVRHPDMPAETFRELWKTIKSGETFQGVIKNQAKDGSPYWVDATIAPVIDSEGQPFKFIAIRFDITEQIRSREATERALEEVKEKESDLLQYKEELEQNLEEMKTLQNQLKENLQHSEETRAELRARQNVLDQATLVSESDLFGTITFTNAKFCEVSQYSREELIGQPHNILRHPDVPKSLYKSLWTTIKAGQVWRGTIKNKRKDGTPYWVDATIAPVLGEDGKPLRYIGIRHDITDRVLAEEHNKELLSELQERYEELKRNQDELQLKKKMTESITYAKRIQTALLPSDELRKKYLPKSFVLYKPKDIVSGDFYWFHRNKRYTVISAIDCTGHGVPGAIMSVISNSMMNETIIENEVYEANQVLDLLQQKVIYTLKQEYPSGQKHDGWDMGLVIIDHERKEIQFSGAKHLLYYFEDGHLEQIKGDKMAIGGAIYKDKKFTRHVRPQKPEAQQRLYLFSDGLPDQFGGPNGRKFMTRRVRELLTSIQDKPIEDHLFEVDKAIEEWMQAEPQLDDMVMVGLEV